MPLKLPSVIDSDLNSLYATDEKPYLFQNDSNLPDDVLINHNLPLPQEMSARAVKLPGTAKPGFSEVYRNGALPNGIKESITLELNTYPKIFASSVKRHPHQPCLAHHEYDYENEQHMERYASLTYQQIDHRKTNFINGLMFLLESNPYKNLALESHQKIVNHSKEYTKYDKDNISFIVTLYSGNRAEWIITDLACSANSVTTTALYDTLGPASSKFILQTTESPVVVCSKNKIESLIKLKAENAEELKSLITIISMDPLNVKGNSSASLIQLADKHNIKLYDFNQVEKIGEVFPREETSPTPETTFTITFTSGTTGANPKGVVLSQRSATSALLTYVMLLPHNKATKEFCFLPLTHIFERHMSASILFVGGTVGFPRLGGTPQTLFEDLKLFKPTFLACVPRIFTKIEAAIKASTVDSTSRLNRALYSQAIETKQQKQMQNEDKGSHFLFDKTLIRNLRSRFGFDNMEFCITGSAPVAPDTIKFLKASLGIGMSQGYGLSESFAGMLIALPFHSPSVGTCGAISPVVEARLRELPEMGYYLNDKGGPRGELQLRGAQMFSHYYKNPEETKKSIDEDGWFSTGDVAQITNEGWFIIFDRVKNFFKLAQGEYVTPEKVENLYLSSNSILTQMYAHGDFTQAFLVGIIGVDPVNIVKFLTEKCNISKSELDTEEKILEICNGREVRTRILLQLNTNIGAVLNGFEKLANIYIEFEPLKLEREVVTPTSKIRRPIAARYFKKQIDAMYKEGSILKNLKL
ncbi:hypothetical protein CORT_0H01790 [Candida orthopsilosis Co 90-125]|uniref:AMP-dependent synthetase/ligase domain-containing protein n=1 Tax=Candida orthopsilosis (strain 90-125) TaxID=1136231 RepID=H8XB43_CANO9|nr:hypothetical protein CORT_0H01790 [Candida orthopsilosis Co 90-125]CCG25291.1 hypothetical protein CORT_0H01790 [Candida orthopsilosis Co 90-125]